MIQSDSDISHALLRSSRERGLVLTKFREEACYIARIKHPCPIGGSRL